TIDRRAYLPRPRLPLTTIVVIATYTLISNNTLSLGLKKSTTAIARIIDISDKD
ncbi:987_t:CDS:2, partial [Scutellospora calospora]